MEYSDEADSFIVFSVADRLFALPIAAVLKVINSPPIESNLKETGLVTLGQYTIPLLDLHQKRNHQSSSRAQSPFLVITRWSGSELYAVPVDAPPNLIKFPQDSIRMLPETFERDGIFRLVNQVAVLSQEEKTLTIFLLDPTQALKRLSQQLPSQVNRAGDNEANDF